jgi:uncharacterized protein YciI
MLSLKVLFKERAMSEQPALTPIPGMTIYYLGLLLKGPAWTAEETPEVEALQQAHLAYLDGLRTRGVLVIVGPILDGGVLRGTGVYKVASLAEAQALMAADPAVQAGRFAFEVHPWMVHEGVLP